MKYIDAEKLVAELTKMQFTLNAAYRKPQSDNIVRAISLEYDDIFSLIDSLQQEQSNFPTTDEQMKEFLATHPKIKVPEKYKNPDWLFKKQEQPEVDLEKEMDEYFENMVVQEHENIFEDTYHNIARHFYELGKQAMKEQMLKDAVEGEIEDVSFNNGEVHNTIRFSFDEESLHVENRIWFPRSGKDGDKVRIIIVKED